MNSEKYILLLFFLLASFFFYEIKAQSIDIKKEQKEFIEEELDIKELILEHLADSYEWHILTWKDMSITIPLPVIIYSSNNGLNIFLSSKFNNKDAQYKHFFIAQEGEHIGKIVEKNSLGKEVAPLDLSLTKNATSLIISSFVLLIILLRVASTYKNQSLEGNKGFTGAMEFLIVNITEEVIEPSIGKEYLKYAPYLLSVFFFILFNNLLGLVPIFPGGANVTGNIAVTLVLAISTFLVVNLTGSKAYYKDIFWPDVPTWLKVPFPLLPIIEIVGTITKPFALMIRLFANITAGHSIVLGLTTLVFVTVKLGTTINLSMSALSVFFNIFINFLEIFVAFIQAYVFTLLSAVFIGLAREPEKARKEKIKTI